MVAQADDIAVQIGHRELRCRGSGDHGLEPIPIDPCHEHHESQTQKGESVREAGVSRLSSVVRGHVITGLRSVICYGSESN